MSRSKPVAPNLVHWSGADMEFAAFVERTQRKVRSSDVARRILVAEGRQIVPTGDRMAREFTHKTEVLRNALRRHNASPHVAV